MANYPTQLDEIDQWLADNFGILPGACASTENLRHNTARMIAEALWPKCKVKTIDAEIGWYDRPLLDYDEAQFLEAVCTLELEVGDKVKVTITKV